MVRLFRHYMAYSSLLLAVTEATVMFLVFFYFAQFNFAEFSHASGGIDEEFTIALLSTLCLMLLMAGFGLYNKQHFIDYRDMFARMIVSSVAAIPLFFGVFYIYSSMAFSLSRIWHISFLVTLILVLVMVGLVRTGFLLVADISALKRRILVYGVGAQAKRVQALASRKRVPFLVTAYVRAENEATAIDSGLITPHVESLLDIARRARANEIVVAVSERRGLRMDELLDCRTAGIKITDHQSFFERETGRVELEGLVPSWLVYCDGFRVGSLSDLLKRCTDISLALAFLLVTAPLMAATAVAIWFDNPGPILYRQERVGKNGRLYMLMKFRSMRTDAEKDGKPRWASGADDRVTRVGRFIRMTRIDELPQIFNVLQGDMSFIGPRPERPFFVNELLGEIPYYDQRHSVRPGISGWAQINYPYGASVDDAREKLTYDLYYIKNYSIFLDIVILIETIRAVVWARGAR
jgi:sugar transferase (PEP-CTERM system associated)